MTKRILIIGGYGNFGSYIAKSLANEPNVTLIIAGRSAEKAQGLAKILNTEWAVIDIDQSLDDSSAQIKPDIVIHTSGPFQSQDYAVAKACIRNHCHYIDLADAREFVSQIGTLNDDAAASDVLVISGASSVPCLTSAIIDAYQPNFKTLERIDYAITTAQQTNRGLATTSAILSYAGRPFTTLVDGKMQTVYGWQNLHFHQFTGLGWRPLGNCDVPDLSLFPNRYPELKTIRFYAGLEVTFEHIGLWLLTWLVRIRFIRSLEKSAPFLLKLSRWFDGLGSGNSGFYMKLSGTDLGGKSKSITFNLTARDGSGPYIPCTPAILLAKQLAEGVVTIRGAYPCIGFINLEGYLAALNSDKISWKSSAN